MHQSAVMDSGSGGDLITHGSLLERGLWSHLRPNLHGLGIPG